MQRRPNIALYAAIAILVLISCAVSVIVLRSSSWWTNLGQGRPTTTSTATATSVATPRPAETPVVPAAPPTEPTPGYRLALPLILRESEPTPTPAPTKTTKPTKTPKPTPTPTLPWPEALDQPSHSKIGIHVQWNNDSEIMEFVRRMKPAVVKSVGDFGFMAELKEVSPSTVTIGRLYSDQPMDGDPDERARAFVEQNLATYQSNPAVDYWEGYNEPGVGDKMAWYAQFEAERVRIMASYGLKCAVGAFSTGVPEWDQFADFLPAIRAAKQYGGILPSTSTTRPPWNGA